MSPPKMWDKMASCPHEFSSFQGVASHLDSLLTIEASKLQSIECVYA